MSRVNTGAKAAIREEEKANLICGRSGGEREERKQAEQWNSVGQSKYSRTMSLP
jgi:hypothetical protein